VTIGVLKQYFYYFKIKKKSRLDGEVMRVDIQDEKPNAIALVFPGKIVVYGDLGKMNTFALLQLETSSLWH